VLIKELGCVAVGWQLWVALMSRLFAGWWLLEGAFRSVAVRRWRMYCVILVIIMIIVINMIILIALLCMAICHDMVMLSIGTSSSLIYYTTQKYNMTQHRNTYMTLHRNTYMTQHRSKHMTQHRIT
jgi:hypothetical protein